MVNYVFIDLEKVYDRVPGTELWYCMRELWIPDVYIRVLQCMYKECQTIVRCAVCTTKGFPAEVGLHQGPALSPFLYAIIMG